MTWNHHILWWLQTMTNLPGTLVGAAGLCCGEESVDRRGAGAAGACGRQSWWYPKSASGHGWPWLSTETYGDDWGSLIKREPPTWCEKYLSMYASLSLLEGAADPLVYDNVSVLNVSVFILNTPYFHRQTWICQIYPIMLAWCPRSVNEESKVCNVVNFRKQSKHQDQTQLSHVGAFVVTFRKWNSWFEDCYPLEILTVCHVDNPHVFLKWIYHRTISN